MFACLSYKCTCAYVQNVVQHGMRVVLLLSSSLFCITTIKSKYVCLCPDFAMTRNECFFALLFRAFRYVSSCIEKVCSTKITDLFCYSSVVNQCWTYSVVVLVLGGVRHSKKMLLPDCYQVPRVLVHSITSKGKKVEKNCCIGSLTVPLLCYVPYALCIHK